MSDSEAESEASNDGEKDRFKLILRSAGTKNVTVTVRPTTTCGAIVATFLRKASKTAPKARLMIDGQSVPPDDEIGDHDLEDGDVIDVMM